MILRDAEKNLNDWLRRKNRKPLIIRGARQVGKSTLVRLFSKNCGQTLCEINLERHPFLEPVFRSMDLPAILRELSSLARADILEEGSLLFLDEIQAVPSAIAALRYFYEEYPRLPVIAAGSLLEFALAGKAFSMPVGRVEFLHLSPLSFGEYLGALDAARLAELRVCLREGQGCIPATLHRELLRHQRSYLAVGGMPEVVQSQLEGGRVEAQRVQDSILSTYVEDFSKYARQEQLARLQKIFNGCARMVGRKVKYARLSEGDGTREVKAALDLLARAGVIHRVVHTQAGGLPLGAETKEHVFKLLFLDSGLLCRMLGLDARSMEVLSEIQLVNEGPLAEQFVGQQLLSRQRTGLKPELFYWLREGRSVNAEVDFVIAHGGRVLPAEVKAGTSGSLRSLLQFNHARDNRLALRFDLNLPSYHEHVHGIVTPEGAVEVHLDLLSLPLYLAEFLDEGLALREKWQQPAKDGDEVGA